jgi:hypothetical protein
MAKSLTIGQLAHVTGVLVPGARRCPCRSEHPGPSYPRNRRNAHADTVYHDTPDPLGHDDL